MEDTLQQEKQESEYMNPSDGQGGIRRRLRDRDLLKKRKAEAEEKETNQAESQRKRARSEGQIGGKRRGRPRKTNEPTPELVHVTQEEPAAEGPAVVVVPEPAQVLPDQATSSLTPIAPVEINPSPTLAPTLPQLFGSLSQKPLFAPAASIFSPSSVVPAPSSAAIKAPQYNPVQIPALDLADPVPNPAPIPVPVPIRAPVAVPLPVQVPSLYVESRDRREPEEQVLVEDLGPEDDEEEFGLTQDKRADDDADGTPLIDVPEQSKMFSIPTYSSQPSQQEYLPGNSF